MGDYKADMGSRYEIGSGHDRWYIRGAIMDVVAVVSRIVSLRVWANKSLVHFGPYFSALLSAGILVD